MNKITFLVYKKDPGLIIVPDLSIPQFKDTTDENILIKIIYSTI